MKRLTPESVRNLILKVRKRDQDRCVIHGTLGSEVHELLFKSSGPKLSSRVYQEKYMACLCRSCHYDTHHGGQKTEVTEKAMKVLEARHGYSYRRFRNRRNERKIR